MVLTCLKVIRLSKIGIDVGTSATSELANFLNDSIIMSCVGKWMRICFNFMVNLTEKKWLSQNKCQRVILIPFSDHVNTTKWNEPLFSNQYVSYTHIILFNQECKLSLSGCFSSSTFHITLMLPYPRAPNMQLTRWYRIHSGNSWTWTSSERYVLYCFSGRGPVA